MSQPLVYHNPPSLCEAPGCGGVLDRVLVEAGYSTHPACDPSDYPWRWRGDAR